MPGRLCQRATPVPNTGASAALLTRGGVLDTGESQVRATSNCSGADRGHAGTLTTANA